MQANHGEYAAISQHLRMRLTVYRDDGLEILDISCTTRELAELFRDRLQKNDPGWKFVIEIDEWEEKP